MSTIKTQRARKIILMTLCVTFIASIGLVVHAELKDTNNNIVQLNNLSDDLANSYVYDDMLREIKSNRYQTNISSVYNKDIPSLIESMLPDLYQYKKVTVIATGYTAGPESTGKDISHPEYGVTYSGVQVRRDVYSTIAADLKIFPLGTVLYIPNYGYGVVTDIGSAIRGNEIDLYFDSVDDVYTQWGKRKVDVYVVKYGDGIITDHMLDQYNQLAMASLSS